MAKKDKATPVPGTEMDISELASVAGVDEYRDEDHRERRSPRVARPDYEIENDPILAEGDSRVRIPQNESMPEVETESPGEESAPAIEIAHDADPIARLAAVMEKALSRPAASMDARLMERLVAVMEKVAQGQQRGTAAATEALLKGKDPSNMHSPGVSVFNPRGELKYPRPKLKCRVFLPWEAEAESLTREEIELINLLEEGEYTIKRNDDSRIAITIKGEKNPNTGNYDRLLMNSETGFNNDYAYLMPPLRSLLRQILGQRTHTREAASKIMSYEEELEKVQMYGVDFDKVLATQEG